MGSNNLFTYNTFLSILLYLVLGGEVADDQFNNYTGPIVIQDVECSGNESHPSECNVNTFITTECFNSSSIVSITCFFISKFDSKYSIIIIMVPKEEIGLLMVDLLKTCNNDTKTENFNSYIVILYVIYSELDINFFEELRVRNKRELFKNIAAFCPIHKHSHN